MKIQKTAVKMGRPRKVVEEAMAPINELAQKAQSINSCSNYVKNGKLSENDAQRFIPAALAVIKASDVEMKKLLSKMYAKVKDYQGKPYKRLERVFAALVAKDLQLSTSTVHEKLTELVNLANRPLIHSMFGKTWNDKQLDSIRSLVYKFQI